MRKNEVQNTRKFWKNTQEMAVSPEVSEYFTKKMSYFYNSKKEKIGLFLRLSYT